jgi:hypothetical protein
MIFFFLQLLTAFASDWKPSFQLIPESAWQPPAGNFSLGTSFMRFAPTDYVSFSAVHIFYIPIVFEQVPTAINGSAKVRILKDANWWINADIGFLRLDMLGTSEKVDENVDAIFFIYPMQLKATRRLHDNISIGAILKYNKMGFGVAARNDGENQYDVNGTLATSNSHLKLNVCLALSDTWSIWYHRNRMLHQDIQAENYNVVELENGTKVETFFQGVSDVSQLTGAKSFGFRLYRKGEYLDYMVGADFGDTPLYLIGVVPPKPAVEELKYLPMPYVSMNMYF